MSFVTTKKSNQRFEIVLNRPEKRNAFNAEMIAQLTEAFQKAQSLDDIHMVTLSAEGKSFSAGADLDWMKSMVQYSEEQNRQDSMKLREMYWALKNIDVPVLGAARGHVMGGALGLIALCDIACAESGTKFCFSEVKLGLSPAVVSEFIVGKIPRSLVQKLFLTAEVFEARQACDWGLIHHVGDTQSCLSFVDQTIEQIQKNGPVALRETKKLLRKLYASSQDVSQFTVPLIAKLRVGAEGQEGLGAFFERRPAKWVKS